MRVQRFEWQGAEETARRIRQWVASSKPEGVYDDVVKIRDEIEREGDAALHRLTAELDRVEEMPETLRVAPAAAAAALEALEPNLRDAMQVAADNIRSVAESQVSDRVSTVDLPEEQAVTFREFPVERAGVYAPGGRAAYPSSVLMCAIPAQVAGVERVTLVSPPDPQGKLPAPVLAAAALCEIDEIYAIGGAQAIFALAYGTETVDPVDVIAGPGNAWVQEAKRAVMGIVGIDSYAGPSELMLVADEMTEPGWAALDLCAQAEHGTESPLVLTATAASVLDSIVAATESAAASRPSVCDAPLALVEAPDCPSAIDFANALAPEHLELLGEEAALYSNQVHTAGCVFVGDFGATAFGDYVAGSNHVLPTTGTGRFSGPLGPGTFRRRVATVSISADAAVRLAPQVDVLARAEGFPVHGESAMIRTKL